MQPKILIEVRGGTIVKITANDPDIEISVIDYDILESEDTEYANEVSILQATCR